MQHAVAAAAAAAVGGDAGDGAGERGSRGGSGSGSGASRSGSDGSEHSSGGAAGGEAEVAPAVSACATLNACAPVLFLSDTSDAWGSSTWSDAGQLCLTSWHCLQLVHPPLLELFPGRSTGCVLRREELPKSVLFARAPEEMHRMQRKRLAAAKCAKQEAQQKRKRVHGPAGTDGEMEMVLEGQEHANDDEAGGGTKLRAEERASAGQAKPEDEAKGKEEGENTDDLADDGEAREDQEVEEKAEPTTAADLILDGFHKRLASRENVVDLTGNDGGNGTGNGFGGSGGVGGGVGKGNKTDGDLATAMVGQSLGQQAVLETAWSPTQLSRYGNSLLSVRLSSGFARILDVDEGAELAYLVCDVSTMLAPVARKGRSSTNSLGSSSGGSGGGGGGGVDGAGGSDRALHVTHMSWMPGTVCARSWDTNSRPYDITTGALAVGVRGTSNQIVLMLFSHHGPFCTQCPDVSVAYRASLAAPGATPSSSLTSQQDDGRDADPSPLTTSVVRLRSPLEHDAVVCMAWSTPDMVDVTAQSLLFAATSSGRISMFQVSVNGRPDAAGLRAPVASVVRLRTIQPFEGRITAITLAPALPFSEQQQQEDSSGHARRQDCFFLIAVMDRAIFTTAVPTVREASAHQEGGQATAKTETAMTTSSATSRRGARRATATSCSSSSGTDAVPPMAPPPSPLPQRQQQEEERTTASRTSDAERVAGPQGSKQVLGKTRISTIMPLQAFGGAVGETCTRLAVGSEAGEVSYWEFRVSPHSQKHDVDSAGAITSSPRACWVRMDSPSMAYAPALAEHATIGLCSDPLHLLTACSTIVPESHDNARTMQLLPRLGRAHCATRLLAQPDTAILTPVGVFRRQPEAPQDLVTYRHMFHHMSQQAAVQQGPMQPFLYQQQHLGVPSTHSQPQHDGPPPSTVFKLDEVALDRVVQQALHIISTNKPAGTDEGNASPVVPQPGSTVISVGRHISLTSWIYLLMSIATCLLRPPRRTTFLFLWGEYLDNITNDLHIPQELPYAMLEVAISTMIDHLWASCVRLCEAEGEHYTDRLRTMLQLTHLTLFMPRLLQDCQRNDQVLDVTQQAYLVQVRARLVFQWLHKALIRFLQQCPAPGTTPQDVTLTVREILAVRAWLELLDVHSTEHLAGRLQHYMKELSVHVHAGMMHPTVDPLTGAAGPTDEDGMPTTAGMPPHAPPDNQGGPGGADVAAAAAAAAASAAAAAMTRDDEPPPPDMDAADDGPEYFGDKFQRESLLPERLLQHASVQDVIRQVRTRLDAFQQRDPHLFEQASALSVDYSVTDAWVDGKTCAGVSSACAATLLPMLPEPKDIADCNGSAYWLCSACGGTVSLSSRALTYIPWSAARYTSCPFCGITMHLFSDCSYV